MRYLILALLIFGLAACSTDAGGALDTQADCTPAATPLGALPPAKPVWCTDLGTADKTFKRRSNGWEDSFDADASMVTVGRGYRVFNRRSASGR